MLSLKRASFILAPVALVFRRRLSIRSRPRRGPLVAMFLVALVSPFLVMAVYSPGFTSYLWNTFGVDLDTLTSGRRTIYELVVDYLPPPTGFGSLNVMLSELALSSFGTTWDGLLHNDTFRVYLEVGIVGLGLYVGALAYAARTSLMSYFLIGYTLFVLISSRLITYASYWVALFLVLALIERHQREASADAIAPAEGRAT
jgi:hypothetical protein